MSDVDGSGESKTIAVQNSKRQERLRTILSAVMQRLRLEAVTRASAVHSYLKAVREDGRPSDELSKRRERDSTTVKKRLEERDG